MILYFSSSFYAFYHDYHHHLYQEPFYVQDHQIEWFYSSFILYQDFIIINSDSKKEMMMMMMVLNTRVNEFRVKRKSGIGMYLIWSTTYYTLRYKFYINKLAIQNKMNDIIQFKSENIHSLVEFAKSLYLTNFWWNFFFCYLFDVIWNVVLNLLCMFDWNPKSFFTFYIRNKYSLVFLIGLDITFFWTICAFNKRLLMLHKKSIIHDK